MNLSQLSKKQSLFVFVVVYIFAFLLGDIAFQYSKTFIDSLWIQIVIFDVVATLLIWGFGLLIKNASIYDPYWSVFPPVLLVFYLIDSSSTLTFAGFLFILGVSIWAIRLTYNFVINYHGFKYLDWRYKMLKEKNPKIWFLTNLFGINMMPTLIVLIQLIAPLSILTSSIDNLLVFVLGFFIQVSAAVIQFVSDKQMKEFRDNHRMKKACMSEGLWSLSRHPNYFGEVLFWWGVYVMYLGTHLALDVQIISPVLMTLLFIFISIPMMEKKILLSRPEYKLIQEEISMFIPFPKKKNLNLSREVTVEE